ncbi:MAG TPA: hypothetical protein VHQ42_01580, partial [Candidatus Limnocylindria bacterium]|nr:hypothetical protein [Candidatus Limnocylindria bacterium]
MHPSRFLAVALNADDRARERAEAWRRLHRRPDAPPPTTRPAPEAMRRGHLGRALMAALGVLAR